MAKHLKKKNKKPLEREASINLTSDSEQEVETLPDSEHVEKYKAKSKKLKIVKAVLLMVTVLFILGGFSIFRDDISVDGLRYLFKYFDISSSHLSDDTVELNINTENSMKSGIYRSGIAVLKTSSFEIYDYSGEKILDDRLSFTNPEMVIGGKYILVYDIGGKTARIYNTYSLLWEETYDYPITSADINDNGFFCVATGEKGYNSVVYAYNNSFEKIYRWVSGDKYVLDVSYCGSSASRFAVAAFKSDNGDYVSDVYIFDTEEEQPVYQETRNDELVIDAQYSDADSLKLLSDKRFTVINPNGESEAVETSFAEESLKMFCFGENYSAFLVNESIIGQSNQLRCFDANGNMVYSSEINAQVLDLKIYDNCIFALTAGKLYALNPETDNASEYEIDKDLKQILPISENSMALVGDERISFLITD